MGFEKGKSVVPNILIDGRLADWPVGRLAGWPVGRLADWPVGRLAGWPIGRLAHRPIGQLGKTRIVLYSWEKLELPSIPGNTRIAL